MVSDLRKVTKEKNEAQKIIVVEVEGKKNLHLNALNQAKLKRAQAERLLAAFDIAVEEASGSMADKADFFCQIAAQCARELGAPASDAAQCLRKSRPLDMG